MSKEPEQSRHRPGNALDPKVQCEVCMKEIPESEARSREADEYTLYFCGLECYDHWHEKEQRHGHGEGGKGG